MNCLLVAPRLKLWHLNLRLPLHSRSCCLFCCLKSNLHSPHNLQTSSFPTASILGPPISLLPSHPTWPYPGPCNNFLFSLSRYSQYTCSSTSLEPPVVWCHQSFDDTQSVACWQMSDPFCGKQCMPVYTYRRLLEIYWYKGCVTYNLQIIKYTILFVNATRPIDSHRMLSMIFAKLLSVTNIYLVLAAIQPGFDKWTCIPIHSFLNIFFSQKINCDLLLNYFWPCKNYIKRKLFSFRMNSSTSFTAGPRITFPYNVDEMPQELNLFVSISLW